MDALQTNTQSHMGKPNNSSPANLGRDYLNSLTDGASLSLFRIGFGVILTHYLLSNLAGMRLDYIFYSPSYHFRYPGFEWVPVLSIGYLKLLWGLAAISSFLITLGFFYRIASALLAFSYTWIFLQDQVYYLNHYYFVVILSWLMIVIPANRRFLFLPTEEAEDERNHLVPNWSIALIRFQVGIPYFFGGIAKLQSDWLSGHTARMFLGNRPWHEWIQQFLPEDTITYLMTFGGLSFDLLVVPALLYKRTRRYAYGLAVLFHLANAYLFPIGIFPWLMIIATTIFFSPDWPLTFIAKAKKIRKGQASKGESIAAVAPRGKQNPPPCNELLQANVVPRWRNYTLVLLLVSFALIQITVPLRCFLSNRDPSWVEKGHKFAWHMMLRNINGKVKFYSVDIDTRNAEVVALSNYISHAQYRYAKTKPPLLQKLATHIADQIKESDGRSVEIYALALASLNGREPEYLIDPTVPLNQQAQDNGDDTWMLDYTNHPLKPGFSIQVDEWEYVLKLTIPEHLQPLDHHQNNMSAMKTPLNSQKP